MWKEQSASNSVRSRQALQAWRGSNEIRSICRDVSSARRKDRRSRSSTQGEIRYRLTPLEQGRATRITFSVGYSLRGVLAQFARPGLVRDLVSRMTADFARNLERALAGSPSEAYAPAEPALNGLEVLRELLWRRVRHVFRRLIGGSSSGES